MERLKSEGTRFVELWFTDLSGKPWRVNLPASHVDEAAFAEGVTLDGPSTGRPWRGLFTLLPDPASCFSHPVAKTPTLAIFCDVRETESRSTAGDARGALRRAQQQLGRSGVADRLVVGAECEFFLLEEAHGAAACEEEVWDFLRSLALGLEEAGIVVEGFRYGPASGQGRVQMRWDQSLKIADQVQLYQHVAKTIARRSGRVATFVPKPLPGFGAASMPVHHSLWIGDKNLFHKDDGWALTSDVCRWWAGGLLAHAPSLLAFCSPTVNSYRRLSVPGSPTALVLSRAKAEAACRIPARFIEPRARRLKFRLCDASVNPYLAFAAMLMAGLDGVMRKLDPPLEDARSPFFLPRSLDEALEALETDHAFLEEGGVFAPELISAWISQRRQSQVDALRALPHPMERLLQIDHGF